MDTELTMSKRRNLKWPVLHQHPSTADTILILYTATAALCKAEGITGFALFRPM